MTTAFVIGRLRETISRYGLVDILVSDNGRQFISSEFQNCLSIHGINHILTAPGYYSTNDQAENFIKTFKKSILASSNQNNDASLDQILSQYDPL